MSVIVLHTLSTIGFPNVIECLTGFQCFVVSYQMFLPSIYSSFQVWSVRIVMAHHHNIQAMLSYHMLIGEYSYS